MNHTRLPYVSQIKNQLSPHQSALCWASSSSFLWDRKKQKKEARPHCLQSALNEPRPGVKMRCVWILTSFYAQTLKAAVKAHKIYLPVIA